jgi:hypothetical protein
MVEMISPMLFIRDIYRKFFGKDYSQIWKQFAIDHGGVYTPVPDDQVVLEYKCYRVTLNAYTYYQSVGSSVSESDFTIAMVEFVSNDDYQLQLSAQGFLDRVAKLFGAQDIKIGDERFDKRFVVKSNDELKTMLFLSNAYLVLTLLDLRIVRLDITKAEGLWSEQPSEGKFMLYCVLDHRMKGIDQLNKFYKMITLVFDELVKYGIVASSKS